MPNRRNKKTKGLKIDGENYKSTNILKVVSTTIDYPNPEEGFEALLMAEMKDDFYRKKGLSTFIRAIENRFYPEYVAEYYDRIMNVIEYSIRQKDEEERIAALNLASRFAVTLMGTAQGGIVFNRLFLRLINKLQNSALSFEFRKEISMLLALLTFVGCPPNDNNFPEVLKIFYQVFRNFLPKYNGRPPRFIKSEEEFYISSIDGICLLLTSASPCTLKKCTPKLLEDFMSVLMSRDQTFTLKVAEAIGLVYEIARTTEEYFVWEKQDDLLKLLKDQIEIIPQTSKCSKENKRLLRKTFRDVIETIENRTNIFTKVRIGNLKKEDLIPKTPTFGTLVIDSWTIKFQYKSLCYGLGEGLFVQLYFNDSLKELFKDSFSIPDDDTGPKPNRQNALEEFPDCYDE